MPTNRKAARGFTLIELMMAVAVVAILAAIAYPSYEASLVKSRRKAATACMLELSQFMERFYTTNLRYHLDRSPTPVPVALPALQCREELAQHYDFDLNPATTATTFRLRAQPQGRQAAKDLLCGTLTLDHSGRKGHSGSGEVQNCW